MKCWKCGADLAPGAAFCSFCGAAQKQTPPPNQDEPREQKPSSTGNADGILKLFAAVCAMVYGGLALRSLFFALTALLRIVTGFYFPVLVTALFNGLYGVLGLAMCALLVMTSIRRTPDNSDGLLVCMAGAGAALAVIRLINWLFQMVLYRYFAGYAVVFFKTLAGVVIAIGGVYLIERFLLGENPIAGKSADDLRADVRYTLSTLGQAAGEVGAQASQAAANARAEREARAAQRAQYDQYDSPYAAFRLKADRSLAAYILLTFLTCGFYSLYFIHALAQDVNVVCAGDGKNTPGLLKLLLLSLITCGFYSFYWYYALGNRLADNAPRYGMNFQENGTTVLLWDLVGLMACGLGPLVAMHIIIKNTNSLCGASNYQQDI